MSSTNGSTFSRYAPADTIEALLRSIRGIRDARILADEQGRIQAIHVAADDELTARQVARNVQSALLAQLGILVDHRIVSVFPHELDHEAADPSQRPGDPLDDPDSSLHNPGVPPEKPGAVPVDETQLPTPERQARDEAGDPLPIETGAETRGPVGYGSGNHQEGRIVRLEIDRLHTHVLRCRVSLEVDGQLYDGEAEQLDTERAYLEVAARAAVHALQPAARDREPGAGPNLELDGLERVRIAEHDYVLVAVRFVHGRRLRRSAAAAPVDDAPQDAAVLAVLSATTSTMQSTAPTRRIAALA